MKFRSVLNFFTLFALLLSLLGGAVTVTPAYAASFSVGDAASLINAITTTNTSPGSDTITLTANIVLTTANNVGMSGPNGLPVIVAAGGSLIIEGAGFTISRAGGSPNFRFFENQGNLTLNNITLSNGSTVSGGAIFNSGAGTLTITNSALSGNTSSINGGGLYNSGTLLLINSTLSSNSASNGGGIYNNLGTLTLTNSTLSGNSSAFGGGILNNSTATLTNSTLSGNSATNNGGSIFNQSGATLTITNSTLTSNSATAGGGIFNQGTATLTNSTFSGNSATLGGGIFNFGTATLTNSTLSGNSATGGGGIFNDTGGTLHYRNTIIANSTSIADCFNNATIATNTNNLVEDGSVSCSPALTGDPNLAPLQNNGGATETHALLSGSIAIDAGDATTCSNAPISGQDQRGVTRPQGVGCDIGAFELDSTFPTVVADSLVASYASGAGPSNFTVTFSENVYDPTGDTNPDDVTNLNNYLIVEDGTNGTFNTTSCASGVISDDVQVTITSVTYNSGLLTATVNLSSAVPDGSYRLFVCGTTSIADTALNELNNGLSDYTFDFIVGTITTPSTPVTASSLPNTGFAPNKITTLPVQPAKSAYNNLGDIWLEIPSQNIKVNIVGVPQTEKGWDVTWLGNDAGWLNGTAFPSWIGNSVVTAHVTDSNGLAGPFNNLKELEYGDKIIVHLFGDEYIFEVSDSRFSVSYSTSYAFKSLQDHSYLTLITCQGYNPLTDSYIFRRIVRAVLVEVK